MKLYPNLNVELKIQDFGTSWLIVMEGTRPDVELMFNAMYNFGATDDSHFTWDDVKELGGWFYSTSARMVKFFQGFLENRYYNVCKDQQQAETWAKLDAPDLAEHLYHDHRQPRQQYKSSDSGVFSEPVNFGALRNENPDDSFTDAIVRSAHKIGMAASSAVYTDTTKNEIEEMFANL